nr:response regulator [Vallitaleaceae bacterium]
DIYNVYMAYNGGLYVLAIIDNVLNGLVVILVLVPYISIKIKRVSFMVLIYFMAIILLLMVENKAPGLLWLIGISIMATGIINYKYAYLTLFSNMIILIVIGIIQSNVETTLFGVSGTTTAIWFIIISNFFLINILTIFSIDKLLRGLENNLKYMAIVHEDMMNKDEQLQVMYSAINEGVIITDNKGNILNMNYKGSELTGYSYDVAVGKALKDIYQVQRVGANMAIGSKVFINAILFSRSGKEYSIEESITEIHRSGETKSTKVIVFRDMTDHNKIENELRQMQKMQAVGQLAGGIAHDFNNMLGGILGYSELIELQNIDNANLKKYNQTIMETAKRASELTSQLLTFSRQGNLELKMINLHEVIINGLQLLSRTINPLIVIKTDFDVNDIHIEGDAAQLQNAILNLGINARDAMPGGGVFTIKTEIVSIIEDHPFRSKYNIEPGEYVKITASDQGVGILEEFLSRIFDPFFTTKPVGKGTGLGLSALYGTVQSHHGFIEVYSEVEIGTSFYLYFPTIHEEGKVIVSHMPVDQMITKGGAKVLVIDDEAGIRNLIKSMLEFLGYEVILAHNGEEGLSLFHEHHYQLAFIILDVIMPIKNGIDTLKSIRKHNRHIPIVMTTGFIEPEAIKTITSYNISGILNKPFTMKEFTDIIKVITKQKYEDA